MQRNYGLFGFLGYTIQLLIAIVSMSFIAIAVATRMPVTQPSGLAVGPFAWAGAEFTLTSFVGFIALLLKSVAWMMAGRDVGRNLFTANGMVGILLVPASLGLTGFTMSSGAALTGEAALAAPEELITSLIPLMVFSIVVALLGIAALILEIISLLVASRALGVGHFKYAGILAIVGTVTVITIPIVVGFSTGFLTAQGAAPTAFLPQFVFYTSMASVPLLVYLLLAALSFYLLWRGGVGK